MRTTVARTMLIGPTEKLTTLSEKEKFNMGSGTTLLILAQRLNRKRRFKRFIMVRQGTKEEEVSPQKLFKHVTTHTVYSHTGERES